jgi:FkbM family methyltransferase
MPAVVSLLGRVRRRTLRALRVDLEPGAAEWRMEPALIRAAATHSIGGIIDVGASNGSWSAVAERAWPNAQFLLIEALRDHEAALKASGFPYVLAAAGDAAGEIHFYAPEPFGGAASHVAMTDHDITVPMTTIDIEVQRARLPAPYLIKLDTHGFEREILAGAASTLQHSALLVIEAYNFELRDGAMRFHELIDVLDKKGFRPLDLVDPMHRPVDGVLWQLDLVFARADDQLFRMGGYA